MGTACGFFYLIRSRSAGGTGPRINAHPCAVRGDAILASLDLDGRSGGFQILLELRGVVLADGVLDDGRSGLDQVLGFLEAKTRDRADNLDDFDLLLAGRLEADGEFGLGFGRGGRAG